MHLKRQKSPKNWPIERKGTTYLVRPNNNTEQSVPILIAIRDMLKLAKDRREVKQAMNSKQILLNHKAPYSDKDSILLFDVVTILPAKESGLHEKNYRMIIGRNKKFSLQEIDGREAGNKTAKIINKKTLKGKRVQINLSDGRNFISDMQCRVNDSVLINLKNRKLEKCLPLKQNAKAIVYSGKHAGEEGIITEIDKENNRVKLEVNKEIVNILIKQIMVLE
jgi:small subunit ribosomal protein S4e